MGSWEEKVGQAFTFFFDPGFLLSIHSMYCKSYLGVNRRPDITPAGRAPRMAERSGR